MIATCVRVKEPSRGEECSLPLADADAHRREAITPPATAKLVQQRGDEPGAAHAQRVPDRDCAAVDVHPLLVEPELPHDGEALRRERFVQLDQIELIDGHPGAVEELAHRRDRSDPHHRRVDSGGRRAGEHARAARSPGTGTLLAGDHERRGTVVDPARVARRDRPAGAERRFERRKLLERRVGSRMLVVLEICHRHELIGEAAGFLRIRPTPLGAPGERVLFLPRHIPALRHVFARLTHRRPRVVRLVERVDEAPAERRVVERAVAARERRLRLRRHEWRARHRLDTARDEEVAVTGDHGMTGPDDRRQPGCAETVDGDASHRLGKAGEQRGEAGDVAVVLTGLVRTAEPDVLDLGGRDPGSRDRLGDHCSGQIVGPHAREPAAVAPDRGADSGEHDGARHARPPEAARVDTRTSRVGPCGSGRRNASPRGLARICRLEHALGDREGRVRGGDAAVDRALQDHLADLVGREPVAERRAHDAARARAPCPRGDSAVSVMQLRVRRSSPGRAQISPQA